MSDAPIELHPRFTIVDEIATGGMGTIYLAEQRGSSGFRKTVALKRLKRDLLEDEESILLFVGEAKLVADLIHPNIVQVYHLEQLPTREFVIVMEYVPGRNLSEVLDRLQAHGRSMPPALAAWIIARVARGLAYAHRKRDVDGRRLKIVHRDVSPSNVQVTFGGHVKLLDFGIAKALTMVTPDEREVIMGKFPYMAPELAGFEGTDARADLFSLGAVFYELLTGEVLLDVASRDELVERLESPLPSPQQTLPAVPSSLDAVCRQMLELDPDDRPDDADAVRRQLEAAIGELGARERVGAPALSRFVAELFPEARRQSHW